MGHAKNLPKLGSAKDFLLPDSVPELEIDEEADTHLQVLYTASFEEFASKNVTYDMIIWLSISLLLVLAWGIGIIMLLYLPFRRYVLWKDIGSRKLYVTSKEIVYKVTRPSYIPFCGETKTEKHIPLSMVIDIIIEQGCLQSMYGLHTFRIESIAHGKAAPVDELRVQGVHNPGLLRKVIVTQASKSIQDCRAWNPNLQITGGESMFRMESLTLGPAVLNSPSKGWKHNLACWSVMVMDKIVHLHACLEFLQTTVSLVHVTCLLSALGLIILQTMNSPRHVSVEPRGVVTSDLMLHKLDEVSKSVRKLEILVEKNQVQLPTSSCLQNV